MKRIAVLRGALLAAALCMSFAAQGQGSPAAGQAELAALIKAAKAEGALTFYCSPTENVAKRIADGFAATYGIKPAFIRLASIQLRQRYAAEAEAGNFAADVQINSGSTSVSFADEGIKKGWFEPISQANLPILRSGEFPSHLVTGPTAVVMIQPWIIGYNTEKVKGVDVPKDWTDLLNPKWKGQILMSDPGVSDAYIEFWAVIQGKHGESFFDRLRPNIRRVSSGQQAVQGVGAGEASFIVPANVSQVLQIKDKRGPMDYVRLDYTTGVEQHLLLTARAKSKHPNAARLFANYLMSRDGNKVLNNDPGGFTMYEAGKLPKQYVSPTTAMVARRPEIVKALGF